MTDINGEISKMKKALKASFAYAALGSGLTIAGTTTSIPELLIVGPPYFLLAAFYAQRAMHRASNAEMAISDGQNSPICECN